MESDSVHPSTVFFLVMGGYLILLLILTISFGKHFDKTSNEPRIGFFGVGFLIGIIPVMFFTNFINHHIRSSDNQLPLSSWITFSDTEKQIENSLVEKVPKKKSIDAPDDNKNQVLQGIKDLEKSVTLTERKLNDLNHQIKRKEQELALNFSQKKSNDVNLLIRLRDLAIKELKQSKLVLKNYKAAYHTLYQED